MTKKGFAVGHRSTLLAIYACLLIYSFVRAAIPAVNEPHYLCKAKHYWQPDFCPGDLFLDSANAHLVFYQTIGFLTSFLSFESSAIIGRLIGLLLVATGWVHLASQLVKTRLQIIASVVVYLAIAALGSFSGEWVVGGIESKVVAYGFLFHALAFVAKRKTSHTAICLGLATSFHPVIGVWSVVACLFATLISNQNQNAFAYYQPQQKSITYHLQNVLLFLVCAAPGLLPALAMLKSGDPEISFAADYLQVFYRLKHHLNPQVFPTRAYVFLTSLLGIGFFGIMLSRRRHNRERVSLTDLYQNQFRKWFFCFVVGSLLILASGLIIGWLPIDHSHRHWAFELQAKLLKFYPFRLADVMLPVAIALLLVAQVGAITSRTSRTIQVGTLVLIIATGMAVFCLKLPPDRDSSRMAEKQKADWIAACHWIAEHSPRDAHFMTPNESWAFKWYAQRAELAAYKDCPQDAPSLIEWNHRQTAVRRWAQNNYNKGYSADALKRLKKDLGVTHLIAGRLGPIKIDPIYQNDSYRVYELP